MDFLTASVSIDWPVQLGTARHILLKPNIGYAAAPPAVVRPEFLAALLADIRRLNPGARVSVMEGVCTSVSFRDVMAKAGVPEICAQYDAALLDADQQPLAEYPNPGPVQRFRSLWAPTLLAEADFRVSVAPFKRTLLNGEPLLSGTVKNLFGLLPREKYKARSPHSRGQLHRPNVHAVICDVYNALGPYFDFGVIDLENFFVSKDWKPDRGVAQPIGRVLSGASLLAVDLAACEAVGEPPCRYQEMLNGGLAG